MWNSLRARMEKLRVMSSSRDGYARFEGSIVFVESKEETQGNKIGGQQGPIDWKKA